MRGSVTLKPDAPWQDAIILACLVAISAIPYLKHLGFYSDDWDFLAQFRQYNHHGLFGFIVNIADSTFAPRPLHGLYTAVLVSSFGLDPLPYHVVNVVIATASVVLLWLVLASTAVTRPFAFATAALYGLLPQLSTVRIWFASNCATLSLFFFLLGTLCALKWLRSGRLAWKAASIVSWIGAISAYEIFIPLILGVAAVLTWLRARAARERFPYLRSALPQVVDVSLALAALAYKAAVSDRAAPPDFPHILRTFLWLGYDWRTNSGLNAKSALVVNFWDTLWLPIRSVLRAPSEPDLGVRLACAAAIAALAFYVSRRRVSGIGRSIGLSLIAAGFAAFCLGYAIFFLNTQVGFSPAGMANRTAVASAIGTALMAMGVANLLVSLLPEPRRPLALSLLVAVACFALSLRLSEIDSYWARAAARQNIVVSQIAADLPWIPAHSTVLIDGVCPYEGRGVVLQTDWDTAGLLSVILRRPLLGDVVSDRLKVGAGGVVTSFYGDESAYDYGDRLFVYDALSRRTFRLTDQAAAQRYFADHPHDPARCPQSYPGHGVPI